MKETKYDPWTHYDDPMWDEYNASWVEDFDNSLMAAASVELTDQEIADIVAGFDPRDRKEK